MKKLQRYSTSDGLACILGGAGEHPGKVCLDADVSALEAENERLRDRIEFLVRHICKDTPLQWLAEELCDV